MSEDEDKCYYCDGLTPGLGDWIELDDGTLFCCTECHQDYSMEGSAEDGKRDVNEECGDSPNKIAEVMSDVIIPGNIIMIAQNSDYGGVWTAPDGRAYYVSNRGDVNRREWLDLKPGQVTESHRIILAR